ncbi:multidrug transporter [Anopheles sinensis]|uniref:Multidrug transporter n=1 Tax=Anopheles sinensis TaxID=74873 RepID=A0A084VFQ2_ANOSI|nr:multidrug transporter [Anopheles sinensis]
MDIRLAAGQQRANKQTKKRKFGRLAGKSTLHYFNLIWLVRGFLHVKCAEIGCHPDGQTSSGHQHEETGDGGQQVFPGSTPGTKAKTGPRNILM